jgi:hypothetical protein
MRLSARESEEFDRLKHDRFEFCIRFPEQIDQTPTAMTATTGRSARILRESARQGTGTKINFCSSSKMQGTAISHFSVGRGELISIISESSRNGQRQWDQSASQRELNN